MQPLKKLLDKYHSERMDSILFKPALTLTVWFGFWILFIWWIALFALRADAVISISYRVVFAPLFIMFICLYFLGIILMGLYWKNHRADDKRQAWVALLAFVAVNSLSFALSCTFFAFKLDFLMDGLATLLALPIYIGHFAWLIAGVALVGCPKCKSCNAPGTLAIFGLFFYSVASEIIFFLKTDGFFPTSSWFALGVLWFWIPDILALIFFAFLFRADMVSSFHDKFRRTSATFIWYSFVLIIYLCVVTFQILVCVKLDRVLDLPWVVVATPLILFAILSVFASISGIIVRRVTDDRRSQEKAVVYLIQKRSELLVNLDTKFDAAMMEKLNSVGTHLGQAMVRLLESAEKEEDRNFSDIKFEVENKLIYAHRSVLHLRRQMWNSLSDLENGVIQFEYDQYSRAYCVKNISYIEFKNALLYTYSGLPEYKKTFESTSKRYKLDVRDINRSLQTDLGQVVREYDLMFMELGAEQPNIEYSDVTFKVQDQLFKLHKSVLVVRSEYFAAMFRTGMMESRENVISLGEETSPRIFLALINAIYTGEINVKADELVDFIITCHQFNIQEVLELSQIKLRDYVNIENAVDLFVLADTYQLKYLRNYCKYYMLVEYDVLHKRQDYKEVLPAALRLEVEAKRREGAKISKQERDLTQLRDEINNLYEV
jgi:hypothetical protein